MSNQNNDDVELKSNNKSDSDLNQKKSLEVFAQVLLIILVFQ